jgi:hypothetical protein
MPPSCASSDGASGKVALPDKTSVSVQERSHPILMVAAARMHSAQDLIGAGESGQGAFSRINHLTDTEPMRKHERSLPIRHPWADSQSYYVSGPRPLSAKAAGARRQLDANAPGRPVLASRTDAFTRPSAGEPPAAHQALPLPGGPCRSRIASGLTMISAGIARHQGCVAFRSPSAHAAAKIPLGCSAAGAVAQPAFMTKSRRS